MDNQTQQSKTARGNGSRNKRWIKSQQNWTWCITIAWMVIANFWAPFGLFGFVCMLTPIIIAISGRGKMSCARICPRGSFIGKFTVPFSRQISPPQWTRKKGFKSLVWAIMMGSFIILMFWAVPKGVNTLGRTVLYFMEVATLIAFLTGIIFKPRSWCTICPMGLTSGKIRDLLK